MKNILELVRKLYTIRTCNLLLSANNIELKKFKVCLEYHIGNCKGPCEGLQNEEDYFKEQMTLASNNMQFEKAQAFKEKIDVLEGFQVKSLVVNPLLTDIDVITI